MIPGVLLSCEGVTIRRGRRAVLAEVQLSLRAGELVRVTGANGSGKSSLLRVLGGLAHPRSGRITRHESCAYVPEKVLLASALKPAELLNALRRIRGLSPRDWTAEISASGLSPAVLSAQSSTLSKGMLQRIALIDAVNSQRKVLLLDEPFAGLDGPGRDWLTGALGEHTAGGGAVVVTDHSDAVQPRPTSARQLAIEDGRCIPVSPLSRSPAVVRVLIQARDPAGAVVTHEADPASSDALLAELLAGGWHIEQVSR